MKINYLIVLLGTLALSGCATNTIEMVDETKLVPISTASHLNLAKAWPLKAQGRYLQKVKTTIPGEQHIFSVHLTIEDQKLEAIAFNDVYGRLYHLTWTPQKITWIATDAIPEMLRPGHIIADFLLTHLPLEDLKTALEDALVREEEKSEENIRIIEKDGQILRRMSRHKFLGYLWKKVSIQNPEIGYELQIETVPLP